MEQDGHCAIRRSQQTPLMSFNVHSLSMHIMDFTVDTTNNVVYYQLELLDDDSGESMTVLRRYSVIAAFRTALLKELDGACKCPADDNRCKPCLAALKQCNFPAKSWFPKDGIQPELAAQRATELSYFLQDVVAVGRDHAPLCRSNQQFLESSLADVLGAPSLTSFAAVPPRNRKGERSASCELPSDTVRPFFRDRSGSVPITSKRLIL
ncbi:hypothetical protein DYB37_008368 [Aphanomyces astaci]|nr:hypothetical protein DYB35_001180 [Aphanomyces astaci]RHZ34446.1 hypothetical protein DYB37_008368 [Aphanomyces astaci]RQM24516.1 hypothetical protein B5M09_001398 [Aphanomyces astaci]